MATYDAFLADMRHLEQLRPGTLRAYRYELAAAAASSRFAAGLDALTLADLEDWIARHSQYRRAARRHLPPLLRLGHPPCLLRP